jgi:hypothetical protein
MYSSDQGVPPTAANEVQYNTYSSKLPSSGGVSNSSSSSNSNGTSGTSDSNSSSGTPGSASTASDTDAIKNHELTSRELKAKSKDECRYSATLDGDMECGSTTTAIQAAQITQQVAQIAGQTAMTVAGTMNMQDASKEGSQSAMMRAGAATTEAAGVTQLSTGGVNAAMGLLQLSLAAKHKSNSKKVEGMSQDVQILDDSRVAVSDAATAGNSTNEKNAANTKDGKVKGDAGSLTAAKDSLAANLLRREGFNMQDKFGALQTVETCTDPATPPCSTRQAAQIAKRKAEMGDKLTRAQDMAVEVENEVSFEQEKKSKEALMSGLQQAFVGAQQITSGVFAMKSAEEMRKAADQLNTAEGTPFALPSIDIGSVETETASATSQSLTGDGDTGAAATEDDELADGPPSLPGPLNLADKTGDVANPLAPGGINPGLSTGDGGGGGGGGLGGGSTSASNLGGGSSAAEAGPIAPNIKNSDKYLATNGGGGYNARGGGGGGKGGGGDDMSGLKDMLSQFLPKKDEGTRDPSLNFSGDRQIAGQQAPTSLLGRNVNIFQRVSAAYQTKEKKGAFGQ